MRYLTLIFTFLSTTVWADATGQQREVLLDNDEVELVRLTYPPGTESGMHGHQFPHRVVYVLAGGTIKLVPADSDKQAQTLKVEAGTSLFRPAEEHNVVNVGDTTVQLLETELKR